MLRRLDMPGILHRFLADPRSAHPAALALAGMLPKLLATVEDGRARRLVARLVPRLMGGPGAGRLVARALASLVEGGRHQEVLSFVLAEFKALLARREDALRIAIEERVREQGGRLVGWALGASVARRVLATVNAELDKVSPDGSELRAAFDEWVRREIARMEDDPRRSAEIGAAIRRVVAHDTVQAWIWDVWSRLRMALEADAGRPSGRTVAYLEVALANLGALLERDPAARDAGANGGRGTGRLAVACRAGAAVRVHRPGGRRLGYRDDHRKARTARRQGPAIRAGERHAGGIPGRRPGLCRAARSLRPRQLLTMESCDTNFAGTRHPRNS